jgi:hypothetical protein
MTIQPYKRYFIEGTALLIHPVQPGLARWRQRAKAGAAKFDN